MKTIRINFLTESKLPAIIGTLFLLPTFLYIIAATMKYFFHFPFPYDAINSRMYHPTNDDFELLLGLNQFIAFGPLAAFIINFIPLLNMQLDFSKESITGKVFVKIQRLNFKIIALSGLIFISLTLTVNYLLT